MSIEFTCPQCGKTLRVADEHAGKQAKCPSCQNVVTVMADGPPDWASDPPPKPDLADPVVNPYAAGATTSSRPANASPHRGGLILTLGILALMCNCMALPGILAWIMGRGDLKLMDAGLMDPEGRGLTQAGMIMGIIGTCLVAAGLLIYVAYVLIVLFVIAAAAAGGGMGAL